MKKRQPLNIAGNKYHYLTALKTVGQDRNSAYIWECECVCGKKINVPVHRLRAGKCKSCGCKTIQGRKAGFVKKREKPKNFNVLNYTYFDTRLLSSIVKSVMRYSEISHNYFVMFRNTPSLKSMQGQGNVQRAVIYLPMEDVEKAFPLDLKKGYIEFISKGPKVVSSLLELIAFVVAHEAKHGKGEKREPQCNEYAWGYLEFFRKNIIKIIGKEDCKLEKFELDIIDDDNIRRKANFEIGR